MDPVRADLLIVIPVLNERDSLGALVAELRQQFGPELRWRVCIVDDGSSDGTWEEVQEFHREDPRIAGLRLSRNFGKDAAILAGLNSCEAEWYLVMDGDGQHPAPVARLLYDCARAEGWDVVNGLKRSRASDGRSQRFSAWLFNHCFHWLSGIDLTNSCDFKVLSRRTVQSLLACHDQDFFFRAMVRWVGYRQRDFPFDVERRLGGTGSWTLLRLVRYAGSVLIQHSSLPLTFIFAIGLLSLAGSALLLAKLIYQYLFTEVPAGYATVVALLLVSLSVNVVVVGTLGLYIRKIFVQTNGRPRFIVECATGRSEPAAVRDSR
ncbi:MAG TPA: glycosyltransferase family 2 protein [Opitutaceae bacterium]|nr:glycosyltransferase family 2 protein [Opitutaceae bacterium]